jgi:hypothetical protein
MMADGAEHSLVEVTEKARDIDQARAEVERIAGSTLFRNAPVLQRLLRYLSTCALEGSEGDLKESIIGVEVFERSHGYDPKIDTIVRVQAHRLRGKLKQYYETEGANDPILIEIPRGHYLLAFEVRQEAGSTLTIGEQRGERDVDHVNYAAPAKQGSPVSTWVQEDHFATQVPAELNSTSSRVVFTLGRSVFATVLLALCLAGLMIGAFLGTKSYKDRAATRATSGDDPPTLVRGFWNAFLDGDTAPIFVYPDATFLLDETNDLFRFRQGAVDRRGAVVDSHLARTFASNPEEVAKAGPLFYDNGYTGTGELESAAIISRLVTQLGAQLTVKRGRDLTVEDLRHHNVILLGSSFQNDAVRDLASVGDFRFVNPNGHIEAWRAQIQNINMRAGESKVYQTERDGLGVLTADYALISIQPGIEGRHRIMLLGGLDTNGTKGAASFVTSSSGIDALMKSGNVSKNQNEPFDRPLSLFQAIVKVDLQGGLNVLGVHLITTHPLVTGKTAGDNRVR